MTTYNPERITNSDARAMTEFSLGKLYSIARSGQVKTFRVGAITLFDRRSFLLFLRDNYPNKLEIAFYGEGGKETQ